MLKQKLLFWWADYWLQHMIKVAIKIFGGVLILGGAAAPVIIASPIHKQPVVQHPVSVQSAPEPVAVVKKPVISQPAPVVAPVPEPVAPPPPPAVTQPKPISPTQPSPGSGAKKLVPTAPDPGTPSATAAPPVDPSSPAPPATGGYTSTNWSGYAATTGNFTTVAGTWKATNVTGNGSTTTADSTWIGIGGVFGTDLIQTGTMNIISAGGTVSTYAFYELLPAAALTIPSLTVSPGDSMSASIDETSPGTWLIRITDVTTGQTFTITTPYTSTYSSAEWIQEDPSYMNGSLVPLARFGTAVFTGGNTTMNGTAATIASSNSKPIRMVNSTGQSIAIPSILTGSSFTVTQN